MPSTSLPSFKRWLVRVRYDAPHPSPGYKVHVLHVPVDTETATFEEASRTISEFAREAAEHWGTIVGTWATDTATITTPWAGELVQ